MIEEMIEILSVMVGGRWRPGIGDPTVLGWVTTVGYFVAAGLCVAYALRAEKVSPAVRFDRHRLFWWGLAIFMLLMGFNKQLDLQILVLQVGRKMAVEQGWFSERDAVRKAIIMGFAFTGLVLTAWLGWTCRRVWRRYILAVSGMALLIIFILIRASGNRLVILGYRPGSFSKYKVLEIGGILCVVASALIERRRLRQKTENGRRKTDLNLPASDS